jgi:hypothetical protein
MFKYDLLTPILKGRKVRIRVKGTILNSASRSINVPYDVIAQRNNSRATIVRVSFRGNMQLNDGWFWHPNDLEFINEEE